MLDINSDGKFEVLYFDYGNEECVDKKYTRPPGHHMKLPEQGVTCRLDRIDYSAPGMSQKHHDDFRSMCINNTFTALFVDNTAAGTWSIELFHSTGELRFIKRC